MKKCLLEMNDLIFFIIIPTTKLLSLCFNHTLFCIVLKVKSESKCVMRYNKHEVNEMKKSINAFQMKELDKILINQTYNSSYELLRYAGKQLFLALKNNINKQDNIVLICGAKNNGGDGLVVYEYLQKNGYMCHAFVDENSLSEENKLQQDYLASLNYPLYGFHKDKGLLYDMVKEADIVVDALVGIGCSRDNEAYISEIIISINKSEASVFSIDIASGLLANSGFMVNTCVVADKTFVVGAYKHAHFLFDGRDVSGHLELIDIGIGAIDDCVTCFDASEILVSIKPRKVNVHKYTFKHVCVLGGSPSMMGSIALSATAALRGGSGLVSVASHVDNSNMMRTLPYEILTPFYETREQLKKITHKKDVIVYGMGVSKEKPTIDVLEHVLKCDIPLIVDGDGLYHLSNKQINHFNKQLVITPHLNELSILAHTSLKEIRNDVIYYVQEVAKKYNCTVICKGPTTIVCHQNKVTFYQVGNNGLATAGTGDVFAGLLASQLALLSNTMQAIETTLAIYDRAANLAKNKHGVVSMIASDVVLEIANAIQQALE